MKYSQANMGRIFIIRLEDGEIIHEKIEEFAEDKGIKSAALIAVGGVDKVSKLIVGPEDGRAKVINPMEFILSEVHEIVGTGTLFLDEDEKPVLHMHISCGRRAETITGCVREGVKTWHILEIVLFELVGGEPVRVLDEKTGFKFLEPNG
ncbi:MAG: PPC domain-containing DNA-binding protein [Halobacteriota archaeon]|nr:PPC domain-containing DNA-binding protein [Halobacteriota archaeon]